MYYGASTETLDYVFGHFTGILITSLWYVTPDPKLCHDL